MHKKRLPQCLRSKESTCYAGEAGSIPGWGRSPGEGRINPLQYSRLGNPRTEEPGGLRSPGSPESDMTERTQHIHMCTKHGVLSCASKDGAETMQSEAQVYTAVLAGGTVGSIQSKRCNPGGSHQVGAGPSERLPGPARRGRYLSSYRSTDFLARNDPDMT